MNAKHALKDMTWVEFRERLAERPVMLLPLGSQEEQGPHAPMGDYMLTQRISEMAAEKSGAIAAPIMPFGYADFFKTVPGGIQLRAKTFSMVLDDMASAFLEHGIERLIIFNGHSSNAPLIDQTVRLIKKRTGVTIPALHIWRILPASLWKDAHGDKANAAKGHGGDPLTSVYKYLYPELLRPDLISKSGAKRAFGMATDGVGGSTFQGAPVAMPLDVTDVTDNGIISGDPTIATAEAGKLIVDWLVDFTTQFVAHWRACDPRKIDHQPDVPK